MRITPISNAYNLTPHKTVKTTPAFTAHPDFYKYNSTFSCYFRRGAVLLSCAKGYDSIEKLFCKIFQQKPDIPKNMLIVGIGNSQEPFSYLASIKGILNDKLLKKNVDLHIVDLQSNPEHKHLKNCAFCDLYDYQHYPKYAEKSIIKDYAADWLEIKHEDDLMNPVEKYMFKFSSHHDRFKELTQQGYSLESIFKIIEAEEKQKTLRWRVNDEVFEFLENTYNNPEKSKWDSRIQDVIQTYPSNNFDIISANNILPYITSDNENAQTVKHIERTLKPNGYFITDPYDHPRHIKELNKYDNIKKIDSGLYQKIG